MNLVDQEFNENFTTNSLDTHLNTLNKFDKTYWTNVLTNYINQCRQTYLDVLSGIEISENLFPILNFSPGQWMYHHGIDLYTCPNKYFTEPHDDVPSILHESNYLKMARFTDSILLEHILDQIYLLVNNTNANMLKISLVNIKCMTDHLYNMILSDFNSDIWFVEKSTNFNLYVIKTEYADKMYTLPNP